jgi:transcriptional regulator with XRE-family HTH domain
MPKLVIKLGKRLRDLRTSKNYSQEYVAHQIDMAQGNYCKLERDKHFPSDETLEKIAALYETTSQELLAAGGQAQIQYNHESPHVINGNTVSHDPLKLLEELLASKDKLIALQARQIELLEEKVKDSPIHSK